MKMVFTPFTPIQVMTLQASTPLAGFSLINGTPTILSWTAPNDGNIHSIQVFLSQRVSSPETGGEVDLNYTYPDGGSINHTPYGGNSGNGTNSQDYFDQIKPGSTVSVVQATALTGGTAIVWVSIWGV
jgi:hypothetical protein